MAKFAEKTSMHTMKKLECAKIPFTLPMAKTKTMVLVFGFGFPFSAGFQGKSGFSFGKSGFSFWFQFLPKRRGWGIFPSFEKRQCKIYSVTLQDDGPEISVPLNC